MGIDRIETEQLMEEIEAYNEIVSKMPKSYREAHNKAGDRTTNLMLATLIVSSIIGGLLGGEFGILVGLVMGAPLMFLTLELWTGWRTAPLNAWWGKEGTSVMDELKVAIPMLFLALAILFPFWLLLTMGGLH